MLDLLRLSAAMAVALFAAGCTTTGNEVVRFQARPQQQTMMRDGGSMITSQGRHSIVSLRPATRLVGNRPVFVVGIQNQSKIPLDFRIGSVQAVQIADGQAVKELKVFSYDELVAEEQSAQVGRAVLVGVLSGVNSGLAGRNSYAQYRADAQNEQLAASVAAAGAQNLAVLEQLAIKDHTILPGEQYAGKLTVEGPTEGSGSKTYSLAIMVGPDRHDIQIVQEFAR